MNGTTAQLDVIQTTGAKSQDKQTKPVPTPRKKAGRTPTENESPSKSMSAIHCMVVLGDSMTKHIDVDSLHDGSDFVFEKISNTYTINQAISAAEQVRGDHVVIHVGTNHVCSENASKTIHLLKKLESKLCSNTSLGHISFSSVIVRKCNTKIRSRIRLVNAALRLICESNNWSFINNSNISMDYLCKDGVHLLPTGLRLLQENIVDTVCKFAVNFAHCYTKPIM